MRTIFLLYLAFFPVLSLASSAEFQINTHTTWDQKDADIAIAEEGRFLVVWNSYRQDGDSGGIFGQLFDPNGTLLGDEFQINTTTLGNQVKPSAAMDAEGNSIVVWQGPGTGEEDVFAQRFDPNAQPLGVEFQVNTYGIGQQLCPGIAMNAAGRFVVVWQSRGISQDPNKTSICGQVFDNSGLPTGPELVISAEPNCRYPTVGIDDYGNFVVVWLQENGSNTIMMRLYNANATAGTEPLQVNTIPFSSVTEHAIAMAGSGFFVITWDGDPELAGLDDIHARLYEPNGVPTGEQFIVNLAAANAQQNPDVAMNRQGEFVIVWNSETDPNVNERDIFGRRYDGLGAPVGGEFQINTFALGDQRNPAVALTGAGRFVTVWQSYEQDGSCNGIFGDMKLMVGSSDFTGDSFVDFRDYCFFAAEWGESQTTLQTDLIEDSNVDLLDLSAFCEQWLTYMQ